MMSVCVHFSISFVFIFDIPVDTIFLLWWKVLTVVFMLTFTDTGLFQLPAVGS